MPLEPPGLGRVGSGRMVSPGPRCAVLSATKASSSVAESTEHKRRRGADSSARRHPRLRSPSTLSALRALTCEQSGVSHHLYVSLRSWTCSGAREPQAASSRCNGSKQMSHKPDISCTPRCIVCLLMALYWPPGTPSAGFARRPPFAPRGPLRPKDLCALQACTTLFIGHQ